MWCFEDELTIYKVRALATKVLTVAVAHKNIGDWAVYIDAVEGQSHPNEYKNVAKHGTKLSYEMGKFLYSDLDKKYRWRY